MKYKLIEFAGLPGCGKTTLVNQLIAELQNKFSYKIIKRSDISYHINIMWKYKWTIPFYFIFFSFLYGNYKLKINLIRYICQYPFNRFSPIYAIYILLVIKELPSVNFQNKIIILDEGVIQFMTSIPYEYNIKRNIVLQNIIVDLQNILSNCLCINCEINIDEAIDRIRKRGKQDRYKFSENLKPLLNTKAENLNFLIKKICTSTISINMMDSTDDKLNQIINNIIQ